MNTFPLIESLAIRETDDWIEIKVNGDLVFQNHRCNATDLLDILQANYDYKYIPIENEEEWENRWS